MPNTITVTADPLAPVPSAAGSSSTIIATVTNETDVPQPGVAVSFTTTTLFVTFDPATGVTDENGAIKITVIYPRPNPDSITGVGVVPIKATIADESATLLLNYYDAALTRIRLINATVTEEEHGLYNVDYYQINAGVSALVYLPTAIGFGSIVTLHWGAFSYDMIYTDGPSYMLFDIDQLFTPADVLRNGRYVVWYSITDLANNTAGSFPLVVTVTGSPYNIPTLLAPVLPAEFNGVINLARAQTEFNVIIPTAEQPTILANSSWRLWLDVITFEGQLLKTILLQAGRVIEDTNVVVVIKNSAPFLGYNGVYGDFYYTIAYDGQQTRFSHIKRMYIDTVAPGD
jgi:hypothetical protein